MDYTYIPKTLEVDYEMKQELRGMDKEMALAIYDNDVSEHILNNYHDVTITEYENCFVVSRWNDDYIGTRPTATISKDGTIIEWGHNYKDEYYRRAF